MTLSETLQNFMYKVSDGHTEHSEVTFQCLQGMSVDSHPMAKQKPWLSYSPGSRISSLNEEVATLGSHLKPCHLAMSIFLQAFVLEVNCTNLNMNTVKILRETEIEWEGAGRGEMNESWGDACVALY